MQFGSRTLAQWTADLTVPAPRSESPPRPAATLTWAARVAAGRTGIAAHAALPSPCPISAGSSESGTASLKSTNASIHSSGSPPLSPPDHVPSPPASSTPPRQSLPLSFAASAAASLPPSRLTSGARGPPSPAPPTEGPLRPSVSSSQAPTKRRRRAPRALSPDPSLSPLPPRAFRGLVNCGNSCFTNVVLQALLACDQFRRLLLRCKDLFAGEVDAETGGPPSDSLLAKFVRLAEDMTSRPNATVAKMNGNETSSANAQTKGKLANGFVSEEPLVPDWFYDVFPGSAGGVPVPGTSGASVGSQEDAEEFLSFVLNGLHEELVGLDKQVGLENEVEDKWDQTKADERGRVENAEMNGSSLGSKANGVWNGIHTSLNDSEEDGVWEEMTRKGKTVEIRGGEFVQSGITDIFGGALRSEVKRGRAKPSVTREPFFSLSLDIESGLIRDVEHAIAAYFEPEQLEGYTMEVGGSRSETVVEARKQVLLQMVPQVLVLHLKRFSHNSVTGALNKVSRQMPFPEELELSSGVMYGTGPRRYTLTAVVTHIGKELAGGHYTCDVRWGGIDSDVWVSCDDSKVIKTSVQKVLRKQAYLLFYSLLNQGSRPAGQRLSR